MTKAALLAGSLQKEEMPLRPRRSNVQQRPLCRSRFFRHTRVFVQRKLRRVRSCSQGRRRDDARARQQAAGGL